MATVTIDLPAFKVSYATGGVFDSDVLSTTDTGSEIVLTSNSQAINVSYFAEAEVDDWDEETLVFMPDTPDGYTLTSATYVTVAYRESADTAPSGSYTGYSPTPSSWPFVSLDSSGTGGSYTVDGLPIAGYDGEQVWPGTETLAWLTATDPDDQFPANRMWLEPGASFSPFVHVHVAYYAIRLTYDDGALDLPCDTTVDLDLSTAVFLDNNGTLSGQYVDGVICTTTDNLYPDFYFPGLTLDSAKSYRVTVTYDPDSAHDSGDGAPSREVYVAGLRPGHEQDDVDAAYTAGGEWSGAVAVFYDTNTTVTGHVQTFTIGPGRTQGSGLPDLPTWDDATLGVAAGYTAPWFETGVSGAVSAISIRKICSIPPLRLTNRDDEFGPTLSLTRSGRSRQGGNRLTGYL